MNWKASLASRLLAMLLLLWTGLVQAHHVLGRPSYSLNEDSNTPPSMQVETQIGKYYVTYMVFPAFPRAGEPGRVNLYATRIADGAILDVPVTFTVRDDSWFSAREEVLGTQRLDDGVYRQGFQFSEDGRYIITASFEADGEPYRIDFPLQIGEAGSSLPLLIAGTALFLFLVGINVIKRRQLARERIRAVHRQGPS